MKVRVKFTKEPPVKFLGHLDIMRFFQKCFVRAGVKMLYTEGFNPHQKMSFALPLGVGITSLSEYLDADIADGQDLAFIKESLNLFSGPGFKILDIKEVKDQAPSLMSSVQSASYEIICSGSAFFLSDDLFEQEQIIVLKKTKKGSKEIDIKPLIFEMSFDDTLKVHLAAGSENNLKPELLLEAICVYNGLEYKREKFEMIRTGLYGPQMTDLIDYQTI